MRAKASAALLTLHISTMSLSAQLPGSPAAERLRLAEITGDSTGGTRSLDLTIGDLIPALRPMTVSMPIRVVPPEFRSTWNSAIPNSLYDGPLWAGVGNNFSFSAGITAERRERLGLLSITIAPAIDYSQNLPYQIRPDSTPGRSSWASRFHRPPFSADLPARFGDRHLLRIDPGRSALSLRTSKILTGITAENEIWGPAIRNQLVMSANAPGIPRIFVGTSQPVRTRIGSLKGKLISGALTESPFFDNNPGNDLRSISGVLVELVPAFDSALTLGFERVVYRPIGPRAGPLGAVLAHSFDALLHWEYLAPPGDTASRQRADQIIALHARWVAPASGFEVYGEWARLALPQSLTELLTAAHHTLGYTIGFQWAQPRRAHHYLRLQAEFTNLEQSRVFTDRPPRDFYTSEVSLQGYTNRGQVIGAAIGPGASSQWIAADWFAPRWQFGSYVGRIRWENDAMYREPIPHLFLHDVTVLTGLRGARRTPWTDISLDATFGYRFNYLFQNGIPHPSAYPFRTVDVRNFTLSLALTPR